MCCIYSAVSGEVFAVVDDYEGKTAKEIKQAVAARMGVSIFQQRFLMEDGLEIPDDEVFHSAVRVQLILLEFRKPELEEDEMMLAASMVDDSEALEELGEYAKSLGVILIYEPLNRYEANLVNTVEQGVALMESLKTDNVKLLADLFHMNIEESNLADAIRAGGKHIGHIHFVDSNRQPTSRGHMNYEPIAQAIKEIDFNGYLSGETFPIPDSDEAARLTIESFKKYFG